MAVAGGRRRRGSRPWWEWVEVWDRGDKLYVYERGDGNERELC